MKVDTQQLKTDLRATAGIIRDSGWCQKEIERDPRGACCLLIAISRATGGDDMRFTHTKKHIESLIGMTIPRWNDAPERTIADVYALLRESEIAVAGGGQ